MRTIAHHLCQRHHDAHVDPARHRRPERIDYDAYLLYHALKDNGVIVKFIAIPVAAHFPYDSPVRESDIYHYWIDWLDQYMK